MTNNEVINVLMKKLGVEVGEKFNIEGIPYSPYYFDKDGNLIDKEGDMNCGGIVVNLLIYGKRNIKKISVKEMTVSEIEKALGYKIKIVADKEEKE